MSFRPAPQPGRPAPADRPDLLFSPGPRLGWVFRDRRELAVPYPEPEPSQDVFRAQAATRAAGAEQALARALRWAGGPSIGLAVILAMAAGCSVSAWGGSSPKGIVVTIIVVCGPGLAYTGWCWLRRDQARALASGQDYQQALAAWGQRAAAHEAIELARLAGQPEWASVTSPASRTDIFGGTLAGWQALLTVHGASILAGRQLLAIDLTGQHVTGMLTAAARAGQVESVTWHLPHDLARCGLLAGLSLAQLADAIAEAIHAGSPAGSRTDRAIDVQVLHQLTGALTGVVTPRRLAAAARTALGHPAPEGLSPAEYELIAGTLFPPGYRHEVTASLVRLDAVLAGLAAHGGDGWPARPARCTCLAIDTAAPAASEEVLSSLIVAWLTVHVTTSTGHAPAVIIAGADGITRPHLERLADACERRAVPLTLMFRHLRDDAAAILGSGTAAFMRLANHAEADQAAAYIGRQHTFVVSSFTATRGGNHASTQGSSDGYGTSDSRSRARASGWQGGGIPGGGMHSGGRTRTTSTGTSRNWSASWSHADGTNWSDAETRQRSYEYAVEPALLQNLPEYALLLADRTGASLQLRAIECGPSIISLPGASTAPLPPPGSPRNGSIPPAAMHPPGPPIAPAGQHPAARPFPAAPEPQPAWHDQQPEPPQQPQPPWWERAQPPEQPELQWWLRNQPPQQRP